MKDSIWNHNPAKFVKECKRLCALCERIIDGKESVIEGSRKMLQYQFWMKEEANDVWAIFRAVDLNSNHLPIGSAREHWNLQALEQKDREIAELEQLYCDQVQCSASRIREQYAQYVEQDVTPNA